ncbi:MAG TPA: UDP-4-amino-4,6-dideoxy-N-acetyl-beta-L-altrosamine transaminase, partial [Gaiellaceae bacterium]
MTLAPEQHRPAKPIPYGRQLIDEDDIAAVCEALRSDWLTTGPAVATFESAFASATGAAEAVAVSSGTAALHLSIAALGIGPGDEVIVPSLTFAASANCVVYCGGVPVFADVDPATLLIDPADVARKITARTKAIVAVDYAGQPCNYPVLQALAREQGLALVADACHSLGAAENGRPVGSLADLSCFSLHPVKHITTGEGGAITTDSPETAQRLRRLRNHGISSDHRERSENGAWFYEMTELGFNYRLTDFQCALGTSQLRKLPGFVERRRELAAQYDAALASAPGVEPLATRPGVDHAYHLYVVRVDRRDRVFRLLRDAGIGANVHYVPVHLHPFYRERFGTGVGLCPSAEAA